MFTRKDLLKGTQAVNAEFKRRAEEQTHECDCVSKQSRACEHKDEQLISSKGTMNDFLVNPYDGPASDTPIGVQESPTIHFNHKLRATANDSYLIIGANLPLVIAVYELLHAANPSAAIYSLEDSSRLTGDMAALNSVIARGRAIKKMCAKVNIATDAAAFGDKTFTCYRYQGTNLIPEKTYLKDELPDKQAPKIAEFAMPYNIDLDVVFVVKADGGVTGETLNVSVSLGNPKSLWPGKY